ncbi:MAG TPA: gephyrin-like molybdotransferase Glp [Candidatus Dormibacteraeota bacterium]|nr:gephyrin-like molybdotransferase Glp [Candidatus Dormibacteraeota bacterium]
MLEYEDALSRVLGAVTTPVGETVAVKDACARVLLESTFAKVDLPAFDNSAMDGYALRSGDSTGASREKPVRLRLLGRVPAGQVFAGTVDGGTCVRIFTGSPVPEGADAVIMQEDTDAREGEVSLFDSVKPWENIRFKGQDVKCSSPVALGGVTLTAARISLLAASGCSEVRVGPRPKVAVLATGSELQESGEPLRPGQIYESNRLMVAALTKQAGGVAETFSIIPDELNKTRHALEQAFARADIVISSGGVSVGEMDFVKSAFEEIGGQLQFWKVAIKPGRPFAFGQVPPSGSKRQSKLFFGLPGNPVSAFVTFLLLVRPAILRWQGCAEVGLRKTKGILAEPIDNKGSRRHFVRAVVSGDGRVTSAGVQASHMLSSLAPANGLIDIPADTTWVGGTSVEVLMWD